MQASRERSELYERYWQLREMSERLGFNVKPGMISFKRTEKKNRIGYIILAAVAASIAYYVPEQKWLYGLAVAFFPNAFEGTIYSYVLGFKQVIYMPTLEMTSLELRSISKKLWGSSCYSVSSFNVDNADEELARTVDREPESPILWLIRVPLETNSVVEREFKKNSFIIVRVHLDESRANSRIKMPADKYLITTDLYYQSGETSELVESEESPVWSFKFPKLRNSLNCKNKNLKNEAA